MILKILTQLHKYFSNTLTYFFHRYDKTLQILVDLILLPQIALSKIDAIFLCSINISFSSPNQNSLLTIILFFQPINLRWKIYDFESPLLICTITKNNTTTTHIIIYESAVYKIF